VELADEAAAFFFRAGPSHLRHNGCKKTSFHSKISCGLMLVLILSAHRKQQGI
jgi:hypothetical protein